MSAILALFGIGAKDYVYAAIIAALLSAGGYWYVHHNHVEQTIGEQKVLKQDATASAAQDKNTVAKEATANESFKQAEAAHDKAVALPPVAPPVVRLCVTAQSRHPVKLPASPSADEDRSATAAGRGTADPGRDQKGPDIGLDLVSIGKNANAYIAEQRAEITALRAEMAKK